MSAAASRGAVCGRTAPKKDAKKGGAAAKKGGDKKGAPAEGAAPAAAPAMSKQAKDAARKKAAAAMRDSVSKNGKAYVRIVGELSREEIREYVLSVRHTPPEGTAPLPILSDWLPIAEVVVADRTAYEVRTHARAAVAAEQLTVPPLFSVFLLCTAFIECHLG